ncbi:hypothetical protein BGZ94_000468, partial [Podila epigama]
PELQSCPPETQSLLLEFLGVMTAKLYCRQAIKLFEKSIYKYHATAGKQRQDGSRESYISQVVFDTKKEMCKAIYALSGTLNHAIAFKESFIMDKTDKFLKTLDTWRSIGRTDADSIRSVFSGPRSERMEA